MTDRSNTEIKKNRHPAIAWRETVEHLCAIVEGRAPLIWWILFLPCVILAAGLAYALAMMTGRGIGVLGTDQNVFWGWDIINFVFWIGIGHAGTLISAILLLTRQQWRSSVSRIAEASTIFAVICAAIFPVFHMGRVWMAWFFVPLPESNGMWPNLLSPLMWDAFAVGTYFSLSCVFLYVSMIPDLAILRDRAGNGMRARFYGLLALGWRGSVNQWKNFRKTSLLLAGLLTPLVISVHSVVSYDFAATVIPGWHSSLFPPYFVVGAILGGLAMVLLVVIPLRAVFKLKDFISIKHLDAMAKLILSLSLAIGFAYGLEYFMALYSGDVHEMAVMHERITGRNAWAFWMMAGCNVFIPQILWLRRVRRSTPLLILAGLAVTLGMWLERFVIIVGSMEQTFIPASWAEYLPSQIDLLMFAGTFGLFFGGILLFIRFFPCVGITELSELRGNQINAAVPGHEGTLEGRYEQKNQFVTAYCSSPENEAILPFAVKELEMAEETPDTISRSAFIGGVLGLVLSLLLIIWSQVLDYPQELQGRYADPGRFIGFFPVIFETVILGAGLGTLIRFISTSELMRWWHPWFGSKFYHDYRKSPAFYLMKKDGEETRVPD